MKSKKIQVLSAALVAGGGLLIYQQRKKQTTDNHFFWERVASLYNKSVEKNSSLYEKVIENTVRELTAEMNVLELATGSGIIGRAIAPYSKQVTATDFSPKMKKCFKGIYGVSIFSFLRSYRMHAAAKMLRGGDESVMTVAGRVGYSNSSKFAAAFKKEMGLPPKEYKKELV